MRETRQTSCCIGLLVVAAAATATAQTQLRTDGRLFDANTQFGGSGRVNDSRIYSPFTAGNLIASGNVRGGLSLRSNSPIGDPTAFRASLGSDSLSNFIRDSVSTADIGGNYTYGGLPRPQAFYDPSRVAPTAAYLSGTTTGGTANRGYVADARFARPGAQNFAGPSVNQIQPQRLDTRLPGSTIASPKDSLSSSIFGISRLREPTAANENLADRSVTDGGKAVPWNELPPPVSLRDSQPSPTPSAALDMRIRPQSVAQPIQTMVGQKSATSTSDLVSQRNLVWGKPTPPSATPGSPSPLGPTTPSGSPLPRPPAATSVLPDADVFTDMQLAMQLQDDPAAEWFSDMRRTQAANQGQGATEIRADQEAIAQDAAAFVQRVMSSKVQTFAGKAETPLNDTLLKAEGLLQIGQYYDAAGLYERAYMMAPTNPLPLMGKAYALLAAGEYASAADALLRGLDRFPDITRFDIDMTAILGGGEVVDIRRADIIRILARNEDARLRFLLGYIEYHTGQKSAGMENLTKAAENAESGSIIRRYPKLLTGEGRAGAKPAAEPAPEAEVPGPNP